MWGTPGFGAQRAEEVAEMRVTSVAGLGTKAKLSLWWHKVDLELLKGADFGGV